MTRKRLTRKPCLRRQNQVASTSKNTKASQQETMPISQPGFRQRSASQASDSSVLPKATQKTTATDSTMNSALSAF